MLDSAPGLGERRKGDGSEPSDPGGARSPLEDDVPAISHPQNATVYGCLQYH